MHFASNYAARAAGSIIAWGIAAFVSLVLLGYVTGYRSGVTTERREACEAGVGHYRMGKGGTPEFYYQGAKP